MLTPKQLAHIPDPIMALVAELEDSIIRDISRRITKANYLTPTAEWQLYKASVLRKSSAEVIKEIAKYTGKSQREIKKIMTDACMEAIHTDAEIHRKAGKDVEPFLRSVALSNTIKAGIKTANGLMSNFTRATAITARRTLTQALDRAYLEVNSGAFTYQEAITRAVSSLGADGLKVVKYASGRTDQMDVAVRRAVLTSVSQTAGTLQLQMAEAVGCDLVEVTEHLGARPSHAEWQGKIYSISGKSKKYPKLSEATGYGTGAGLKGWNCRHDFYPFYEGISVPTGGNVNSEENIKEYEESQRQRAFERSIRKSKRRLTALDESIRNTDDAVLKEKLQRKFDRSAVTLKNQETKMKEWLKLTGRRADNARLQVNGFNRSVSGKAVWRAKKRHQYLAANKSLKTLEDFRSKDYTNEKDIADSIFDFEGHKQKLIQDIENLPKHNEILKTMLDEVGFLDVEDDDIIYAYYNKFDIIYYNPNHPKFDRYDFSESVIHELSHRLDNRKIKSYEIEAFSTAISKGISKEAIEAYTGDIRSNGYLSDIISALTNNSVCDLVGSHPDDYWAKEHNKEFEIFAEMFTLDTYGETECMNYIQKYIPDIYTEFMNMIGGL